MRFGIWPGCCSCIKWCAASYWINDLDLQFVIVSATYRTCWWNPGFAIKISPPIVCVSWNELYLKPIDMLIWLCPSIFLPKMRLSLFPGTQTVYIYVYMRLYNYYVYKYTYAICVYAHKNIYDRLIDSMQMKSMAAVSNQVQKILNKFCHVDVI